MGVCGLIMLELCRILGSHGGGYGEIYLLGYNSM
jgi:hypothetical protein